MALRTEVFCSKLVIEQLFCVKPIAPPRWAKNHDLENDR